MRGGMRLLSRPARKRGGHETGESGWTIWHFNADSPSEPVTQGQVSDSPQVLVAPPDLSCLNTLEERHSVKVMATHFHRARPDRSRTNHFEGVQFSESMDEPPGRPPLENGGLVRSAPIFEARVARNRQAVHLSQG